MHDVTFRWQFRKGIERTLVCSRGAKQLLDMKSGDQVGYPTPFSPLDGFHKL